MVPVVAHDDPDNRGHVGHRDRINGRAITQVRVRLGQHAVQVPRIRVRALVHEHLRQLVLERHQLPVGNALPAVAQTDGLQYDITPGITSNSGETLKQLCLTGNGIACLSDYMINKEIAEGKFVELLADKLLPVEMPFSAVYYSDRAVSSRIRAFIDFLSEHVQQPPQGL